jgi:hypothetical protein
MEILGLGTVNLTLILEWSINNLSLLLTHNHYQSFDCISMDNMILIEKTQFLILLSNLKLTVEIEKYNNES